MCRVASASEVLAVAESCGREVTAEALQRAAAKVWLMREFGREKDELRDWREEGAAI